jgi:hypothetical protein
MCTTFAARGFPRPLSRTPEEHLQRLLAQDALARREAGALTTIVRTFEADRFAPFEPDAAQVRASEEAASRLASAGRDRGQGTGPA